jgi:esterase/lipase superfamily enzyme
MAAEFLAVLAQRYTNKYNELYLSYHGCVDLAKTSRLRSIIDEMRRARMYITKGSRAYVQVKVIEQRMISRDEKLHRLFNSGRHSMTYPVWNDRLIHEGVMQMYALYSLDQLSLADETLELIDEIINEILE